VSKGSQVKVHISAGNQNLVPNVNHLSEDAAKAKLADAGFTNIRVATNTQSGPSDAGKVTSQVPSAQSTAKLTDTITIVVGAQVQAPPPTSSSPSPSVTP
jgi:serine/threonine-protein kinase